MTSLSTTNLRWKKPRSRVRRCPKQLNRARVNPSVSKKEQRSKGRQWKEDHREWAQMAIFPVQTPMWPREKRAAGTRSRHRRTISRAQGSLLEAGKHTGQSRPSIQKPLPSMPRMMIYSAAHPCPTLGPRRRGALNSCAPEKRADARVRAECQVGGAPRGCAIGGPIAPAQGRQARQEPQHALVGGLERASPMRTTSESQDYAGLRMPGKEPKAGEKISFTNALTTSAAG